MQDESRGRRASFEKQFKERRPNAYEERLMDEGPSASYQERFVRLGQPAKREEGRRVGETAEVRQAEMADRKKTGPTATVEKIETAGAEEEQQIGKKKRRRFPGLMDRLVQVRRSYRETELPSLSARSEKQLGRNSTQLNLIEGELVKENKLVRAIYVTSSFFGEGRTMAAVSAAYALSVFNQKNVLLIDTNEKSPSISKLFGATTEMCVQTMLESEDAPEKFILPTKHPNLYLLTAAEKPPIHHFDKLAQIIIGWKQEFDYVVIDGKPILASSDFFKLASGLDGLVLVVECEKTKWEVAQSIEQKVAKTDVPFRGIVLNKRKFYMPGFVYRLLSRKYL